MNLRRIFNRYGTEAVVQRPVYRAVDLPLGPNGQPLEASGGLSLVKTVQDFDNGGSWIYSVNCVVAWAESTGLQQLAGGQTVQGSKLMLLESLLHDQGFPLPLLNADVVIMLGLRTTIRRPFPRAYRGDIVYVVQAEG